ncbi:MAG: hypothetical protein JXA33_19185 [Anaerolineae bacterium]|nr:hypothetical protein [Anaerolineae bacterium]
MNPSNLTQHLAPLWQLLGTQLNEDDLITLCFNLGVDYDADLRVTGQGNKARALLQRIAQADRVYELVRVEKSVRADVDWDRAIAGWSEARLEADMDWWRTKRDWDDADRRERQRVVNVRPLDVTHTFKDRVREALELRNHLADGTVRLVSVVGRGGMGKTALVSHILGDMEQALTPVPGEAGDEDVRPVGLPPHLYSRLRATLRTCGPFGSDEALRAVFVDARITPWRDRLPEAANPAERIQKTVVYLFAQQADRAGATENALLLFLHVLRDAATPGDACHRRLTELAEELEVVTGIPTAPSDTTAVAADSLQVDGILYLSARSTGLSLERIYTDVGRMLGDPAAGRLAARWADRDTSLQAKVEYLLETLREGVYLILLDNMEDVLDEDNSIKEEGLRLFVERCMLAPGGARLIATSREQVQVAPAALSGARRIPLREGLPEEEAMALLRDLDQDGHLGLRAAPEANLRRAAQLTEGIPRALEILAGILDRDPTLTLSELLADEALFGEQVMEGLIAAGYMRLGEEEQRVLEALSVFNRPVDATAISFLLQPWFPALDVRASLRHLVNSYFVNFNRATGEYSLHPLDREYVYRRIPEAAVSET